MNSFFEEATAPERDSASHQQALRRNLSLHSAHFGSFDTFATNEGIMGDKSVWEFYLEIPEIIHRKSKERFYAASNRSSNTASPPPPPPPPPPFESDRLCGGGIESCIWHDEGEPRSHQARETFSRRCRKRTVWEDTPPSRESSDVSSFNKPTPKRTSQRPEYIVLYQPKTQMEEEQHMDIMWHRECLDTNTRLVRWQGTMEISGPRPLSPATNSTLSSSSSSSASQPTVADSEVGWITCYNLQKGLTDAACAAAKDPVLNHFCQRFGLWANRIPDDCQGKIPASLENDALFAPYGTQAAQEELRQRLARGDAPDGAVLRVADVLQGLPIFFISDLFVNPEMRGSGLGLVLLDRACRRVAESFCLVVVFLRDYTDERLPLYLGLLGFSYLAPGFLMRRHGHGERAPRLDEILPFLPPHLVATSGGKLQDM